MTKLNTPNTFNSTKKITTVIKTKRKDKVQDIYPPLKHKHVSKTKVLKNKICMVLPYIGDFHSYFNLFLYSVYKNKNVIDLLILVPDDATPDLISKIKVRLPKNVTIKQINLQKTLNTFESKLTEIFNTKIDLHLPQFNFITNPQHLRLYKTFFNIICRDYLKEYSHWGWIDSDIILGDILSVYPNILEQDYVASTGCFGFLRNIDLPIEAYRPVCEFSTPLFNKAHAFFIKKEAQSFCACESWCIRTITKYNQDLKNKKQIDDREFVSKCITLQSGVDGFIHNSEEILECFYYKNGKLYTKLNDKDTQLMSVRFTNQTSLCKNLINIENYSNSLNFKILPPLNFCEI